MDELDEIIKQINDEFGEGTITTANEAPRPQSSLDREAFENFNTRNPMAGGGMLVQPSADGSRPGYSMSKKEKAAYMREYYAANKKLSETGKLAAERDIKLRNFIGKKKTVKASELRPFLEGLGYEKVDYTKIRKKFPNLKIIKDVQTGNPKGTTTKYDKKALNVANRYANLLHKRNPNDRHYVNASKYMDLDDKGKKKIQDIMTRNKNKFNKDFSGGLRFDEKKEKILMDTFDLTEDDFIKHGKYGVVQTIDGKRNPKYTSIFNFVKKGFKRKKVKSSEIISVAKQNKIKDNFELPEGQEWNFKSKNNPDGFKYGVSGAKNKNAGLAKRIERFLTEKKSYTLAADNSTTKGWMMNSMNRLYENEIKNKVKFENLTYQPIKKDGVIIGFTDNTAAGGGNTYYGLNKNTPENATPWTAHGDFNRVDKFLDIAKGAQVDEPGKLLKQILDDKGITKLMGDKSVLTLNDILSHERFFNNLSKTAPSELIRRQIVLHHTKAVGGDLAQAAATKDIQLLTQVNNLRVREFENIVKGTKNNPARNLSADEIKELKNIGAKITNLDGKVVGGGYTDPFRQFKAIEKGAIDYAKSDQFNVKTVASYLERLGCGMAAGGRVLMSNGGPTLTKCARKGQLKLENIIKKGAVPGSDDAMLATKILQAGRGLGSAFALRNILGPAAVGFTVLAEAGLVGYDMLSEGKTFREAVGDSLFNYALGEKTKIDPQEELFKRFEGLGYDNEQMFRIRKALDTANTINTGMNLGMDIVNQKAEVDKLGKQYEQDSQQIMMPEDEQMQSDQLFRAQQKEKDLMNQMAAYNEDLSAVAVGDTEAKEDILNKYIQSGDYAKDLNLFSNADRLAEIERLENINNPFAGRLRKEEISNRLRELKLNDPNVRRYQEITGGFPIYAGFSNGGYGKDAAKYIKEIETDHHKGYQYYKKHGGKKSF